MEYQATAKYIRQSTRKVRLVADSIRRLSPQKALDALSVMPKIASEPLSKVIESALANAKNSNADPDKLSFKAIDIMGGPGMKRWRAVSRGRAHPYKKRMTHVRIVLTDDVQKTDAKRGGVKKKKQREENT